MLLLVLLCIPATFCMRPEIQQLGNAGILFEQMGNALIYQGKWTLITQVTFADETEVLEFIENCDKVIAEMCNFLIINGDRNNSCSYWHAEIVRTVRIIKDKVDSIQLYSSKLKTKREILDGIGRISKFLFGTMDDRDAANIYDRLEKLETDDKENLHLMSKQLTVVKSKFNTVDNILKNLTHHQIDLERRLAHFSNKLSLELQNITAELQTVHIQAQFNEIPFLMLLKLQQIYFHLAEENTVFTTLHEKKLHPAILSGQDLFKTYKEITKSDFGHPLLNDLTILSQVIDVDYLQIHNKFLIRIQIPLTETIEYTINKIYLLPIPISKTHFYFLDIQTGYIFNNTRQRHYLEFSEQDFKEQCTSYTLANYTHVNVCKQSQPKFIGQDKNNCLINIFDNPFIDHPSCPHRTTEQNRDFLIKMKQKNMWLYNFQQEISIMIRCKGNSFRETLHGQGILTLKGTCSYQMGAYEIPFETQYEQIISIREPEQYKIPKLRINPNLLRKLEDSKLEAFNSDMVHNSDYLNALKSSSKALDELEKEMNLIKLTRDSKQRNIQSHINSAVSAFLIVVIFVIFVIYYRKRLLKQKLLTRANSQLVVSFPHKESKSSEIISKTEENLNKTSIATTSISDSSPSRSSKKLRSFRIKI